MLILLSSDCRASVESSRALLKYSLTWLSIVSTGDDDGSFNTTADVLNTDGYALMFGDEVGDKHHNFFRFESIGLPTSAALSRAEIFISTEGYLEFTLPAGARLHAVAAVNQVAPVTFAEAEALLTNLTTAYHEFNDEVVQGVVEIDVMDIVEEMRALSGFGENSPIVFVCIPNTATGWASFDSHDGLIYAPHIYFDYTLPAAIDHTASCTATVATADDTILNAGLNLTATATGSLDTTNAHLGDYFLAEASAVATLSAGNAQLAYIHELGAIASASVGSGDTALNAILNLSSSLVGLVVSSDAPGWREVALRANAIGSVASSDSRLADIVFVAARIDVSLNERQASLYVPARSLFTHPNGEVVFSRHPRRSFAALEIVQPSQETAAGVPVVGAVVYGEKPWQVTWPSMKPAEYTALIAFWENVAKGSAETFGYLAIAQMINVRFAPGEAIKMQEKAVDSFEVAITLMVE